MPSESCMIWPIRRPSATRPSSNVSTSRARLRSTGSPCLRTNCSAASRRARVSGSSRSSGSSVSSGSRSSWAMPESLGTQEPHGLAALLFADAVEHEPAVGGVGLVREPARPHPRALDEPLAAGLVVAAHPHLLRALDLDPDAGDREAALLPQHGLVARPLELRVHEHADRR